MKFAGSLEGDGMFVCDPTPTGCSWTLKQILDGRLVDLSGVFPNLPDYGEGPTLGKLKGDSEIIGGDGSGLVLSAPMSVPSPDGSLSWQLSKATAFSARGVFEDIDYVQRLAPSVEIPKGTVATKGARLRAKWHASYYFYVMP